MHRAAQPLAYYFDNDRLARGWSYPVKRSRLDGALAEAGSSNVAAVFYSLVMTPLSERGTRPLTVQYGGEVVPSTHPGDVSIYVWSVRSEQRATIADGLAKGAGRCCSVERGDKAARTSVADPKSQSLRGRHRRPSDCTKLDTGWQAPRTTGRQRATLDLPHFTRPRVSEGQES